MDMFMNYRIKVGVRRTGVWVSESGGNENFLSDSCLLDNLKKAIKRVKRKLVGKHGPTLVNEKRLVEKERGSIVGGCASFNVLLKVVTTDGCTYSLTKAVTISKDSDSSDVANHLLNFWNLRDEYYKNLEVIKDCYLYYYKSYLGDKTRVGRSKSQQWSTVENFGKFSGYSLPLNSNYKSWGIVCTNDDTSSYIVGNSKYCYHISGNNVNVTSKTSGQSILSFRDEESVGYDFKRVIGKSSYYVKGGTISLKSVEYNCPKIPVGLHRHNTLPVFLTFDIECYLDDRNKHVPYACGFYDGVEPRFFYLLDYKDDADAMLCSAIRSIMLPKYHNKRVYCHNLSKYDSVPLINVLGKLGNVKIIDKSGKIIYIVLKWLKYRIFFYDSYLLLPQSLERLSHGWGCTVKKSYFPHKFVSRERLDYVGDWPGFEYYSDQVSKSEYSHYDKWFNRYPFNLKIEALTYLENDLISLHQVLSIFHQQIRDSFKINSTTFPTLPSLALDIYRTHFYYKPIIPILGSVQRLSDEIRKAYYGGVVEVYKPYGTNLFYYDVNSLYPCMMLKPMPVGNPTHVKGNIEDSNAFGFFNVIVEAPNIKIPILPKRHNGGMSTICPIGKWSGWYFSEELKEAQKYGYKFKINEAILFDAAVIFDGYVNHFFDLKKNAKTLVDREISKLALNALYGRFGIKIDNEEKQIIKKNEFDKYNRRYNIIDCVELGTQSEHILITYNRSGHPLYDFEEENYANTYSNVAISAAIAAYARIHMNQFKMIQGNACLYTDTDSIVLEKELDPCFVNDSSLGSFKLEYGAISEGVFVAPKVYSLKLNSGEVITKIKGYQPARSAYDMFSFDLIKETTLNAQLSKDPPFSSYEQCVYPLTAEQVIFKKNQSEGRIESKTTKFTLKPTHLKRKPVYVDNKWTDTEPIKVFYDND